MQTRLWRNAAQPILGELLQVVCPHPAVAGEVGSAARAAIIIQPACGKQAEIGECHADVVVQVGCDKVEQYERQSNRIDRRRTNGNPR